MIVISGEEITICNSNKREIIRTIIELIKILNENTENEK